MQCLFALCKVNIIHIRIMKLHRFLLGKNIEQPLGEELKITEKDLIHQWNNVLKFKQDEKISLFDGIIDKDFIYKIKEINNKKETNFHF